MKKPTKKQIKLLEQYLLWPCPVDLVPKMLEHIERMTGEKP